MAVVREGRLGRCHCGRGQDAEKEPWEDTGERLPGRRNQKCEGPEARVRLVS